MQQTTSDNHAHSHDEIDLVDIWLVLMRHKWLLVGVTVLCIIFASVYAAVRDPVYEYATTLEIGGYWSQAHENASTFAGRFIEFENVSAVVAKIKNSYGPAARQQAIQKFGKEKVPEEVVTEAEKGVSSITISVTAAEANSGIANQLLTSVSEKVIQDHGALLDDRRDLLAVFLKERVTEISRQIEDMRESRRAVVSHSSADTKALALLLTDSRLQELEAERAQFRKELEVGLKTDLRPTRIITGPMRAVQPAGPGGLLIVLLGAMVGLMLGIGAVMFRQLLDSAQQRKRQ